MFLFSSKVSVRSYHLLEGATDHHSHLLYGVDDGFQSLEETLSALSLYQEAGLDTLSLTPHVMEDVPNTTQKLKERFQELLEAYKGPIKLRLGAEYMMDGILRERLETRDLLPSGKDGDHILVETSYYNPPVDFYDLLEQIKKIGFHPLLAHPERYMFLEKKDYERLLASGVKMQLNFLSLAGFYGEAAQKKAKMLLRMGAYSCWGGDLHSLSQTKRLLDVKLSKDLLDGLSRIKESI